MSAPSLLKKHSRCAFSVFSALALGFSANLHAQNPPATAHVNQEDPRQDHSGDTGAVTDRINAHSPLWTVGSVRATPFLASSPSGYSPSQIRHAYGFDQISANGAGQTIAIIDAYGSPSLANDVNTFCATFGLPPANLSVYYPQGKPSANSGWALETSLDVEWAHVVAPGAKIVVVVAKTASLTNLLNAVDYAVKNLGVQQVSMSWGSSEFSSETNYDYHFNKSGVSFFASSGDNGAGVIWPAASPYVVGVGGTRLDLDSSGNDISESGWSGSGGGVSAYEAKPAYQNGVSTAVSRGVPDVSYDADPYTGFPVYISKYNGSTGWITVGGTSAGAPQWGALQALANASRSSALSDVDSALYSIATAAYSTDFFDITGGSNGAFSCTSGYDMVTGLGSPNSFGLVPALISK